MRTVLTVLGAGSGLFIFTSVETMQGALQEATRASATDNVLVVYRENRFCPFTSNLPENYASRIARIPGVRQVLPVKVVVNNCGTSLDMITFRGVPRDRLATRDATAHAWRPPSGMHRIVVARHAADREATAIDVDL